MQADTRNTLCMELLQLKPGDGGFLNVPPCEQWFDAIVTFLDSPSTGDITFGAMVQKGSDQFYPVANKGYLTVGYASIPAKSGTVPLKAVVSFFGQPTTGCLGIVNNTDARIEVLVNAAYRIIEDKKAVR